MIALQRMRVKDPSLDARDDSLRVLGMTNFAVQSEKGRRNESTGADEVNSHDFHSAFNYDVTMYLSGGDWWRGISYLRATVVGGLLAGFAGLHLGR